MKDLFKRYWDIIGGIFSALGICVLVDFQLEPIQLAYSIIILSIVCIGFLRFIKESLEKRKNKRKHNIIDDIVDAQKPIKAINIAQHPEKPGKELGKTFILTYKEVLKGMEKLKKGWQRYKGYALSILTAILSIIESHYGLINGAFGGVLVIHGVEILPLAFLILTLVVALLSNNFDSEEWQLILKTIKEFRENKHDKKALNDEVKKILKEYNSNLKTCKKDVILFEKELKQAETELAEVQKSLEVKEKLYQSGVINVADYQVAKQKLDESNKRVHKVRTELQLAENTIKQIEAKQEKIKNQEV